MIKRLVSKGIGMGGLAVVLAAAGALSGCASGQQETGAEIPVDPNNPNVRRAWLADLKLKNDRVERLHQTSEHVFVYTDNNHVIALSRGAGAMAWGAQIGEPFTQILPPLEVGEKLVFPVNTRLFIYDKNGVMDRAQTVGFAMPAPGVTDGKNMVYVPAAHSESQRVAAVDIRKQVGAVAWEFMVRGPVTASPVMSNGVLYVGSEDNRVYAVTQRRSPLWPLEGYAFQTGGRIVADLKADDFGVYVASTDTKLYCLDRQSGRIKWTYYGEAPLSTPPFVTKEMVYQYSPAKGLVGIEKTAGVGARTQLWNQTEAVQVLSAGAKGVYVRFRDNSIGALNARTGQVLWRGTMKYAKFLTNETDALIFAAMQDGAVHAYLPVGEAAPQRVVRAAAAAGAGGQQQQQQKQPGQPQAAPAPAQQPAQP